MTWFKQNNPCGCTCHPAKVPYLMLHFSNLADRHTYPVQLSCVVSSYIFILFSYWFPAGIKPTTLGLQVPCATNSATSWNFMCPNFSFYKKKGPTVSKAPIT